jgi:hypothetical protein
MLLVYLDCLGARRHVSVASLPPFLLWCVTPYLKKQLLQMSILHSRFALIQYTPFAHGDKF